VYYRLDTDLKCFEEVHWPNTPIFCIGSGGRFVKGYMIHGYFGVPCLTLFVWIGLKPKVFPQAIPFRIVLEVIVAVRTQTLLVNLGIALVIFPLGRWKPRAPLFPSSTSFETLRSGYPQFGGAEVDLWISPPRKSSYFCLV